MHSMQRNPSYDTCNAYRHTYYSRIVIIMLSRPYYSGSIALASNSDALLILEIPSFCKNIRQYIGRTLCEIFDLWKDKHVQFFSEVQISGCTQEPTYLTSRNAFFSFTIPILVVVIFRELRANDHWEMASFYHAHWALLFFLFAACSMDCNHFCVSAVRVKSWGAI